MMKCPVCRSKIIIDAYDGIKEADCLCTHVQLDAYPDAVEDWQGCMVNSTSYPSDESVLQSHRYARADKRRASLPEFWRRSRQADHDNRAYDAMRDALASREEQFMREVLP